MMSLRHAVLLFFVSQLASWYVAAPARAQWVSNGVPLCRAYGWQGNPVMTSDGAGGAIGVWRDERYYPSNEMDIFAQRVAADGTIPQGWPTDGFPVCVDPAYQDAPAIVSDGLGGAYVTWMDARDYPTNHLDVYI